MLCALVGTTQLAIQILTVAASVTCHLSNSDFFPGGPTLDIEQSSYNSFDSLPATLKAKIVLASTPVFVSLIIYSLLPLRLLLPYQRAIKELSKSHQRAIKEPFSAIESISLNWLSLLIWLCIAFAIVSFISEILRAISDFPLGPRAVYPVIASVVIIYFIGLMELPAIDL